MTKSNILENVNHTSKSPLIFVHAEKTALWRDTKSMWVDFVIYTLKTPLKSVFVL